MSQNKINLDDLITFADGTNVDLREITEDIKPEYALLKEEVDEFLQKPKEIAKKKKNNFFETVPEIKLKRTIDNILKTRNIEEERIRKHIQFEFDLKMSRINKIKSKTYRRMKKREKLKKEVEIESSSEDEKKSFSENSEENDNVQNVIMTFKKKSNEDSETSEVSLDTSKKLIEMAFQNEENELNINELEFIKEKAKTVEKEAPQIIETVLPGWNTWGGIGIETRKTKQNTFVETKEGVKPRDRKDFNRKHLIINEKIQIPEKYKSEIPYGYTKTSYNKKISTPISLETNSLRVFKRFVKMENKEENPAGKKIEPSVFKPDY